MLLKINGMLLPQIDGNTDFKTKSTLNQNQKQMLLRSLLENKNQYTNEQLSRCSTKSNDLCKNPALYLEQPVCSAGIDNCSISSTGQVYPCTEWTGFKIGDINLNSLKEIWERSEQLKQLRAINKRKNYKKCLSCEALDYCKVCLMLNQAENCGEILQISKNTCNEAFMTKDVLEKTR
jgi:radical SAM protein with 4Fe4S-binding SPASM domain